MTQSDLKKILHYDPDTGIFIRLISKGGNAKGTIAGNLRDHGYVRIVVGNKKYYAHQLAFLYMTGVIPKCIDHIDRNRSNNRWSNLREATVSQNLMNSKKRKNSKSKYKGVSFHNRRILKWAARINVNKKEYILGYFKTQEEAAIVYNKAATKYFGEFAKLNIIKGRPLTDFVKDENMDEEESA
jgi:hypothetical protein